MEGGKRRLVGDSARAPSIGEVQDLRRLALALKESVADLTLEIRILLVNYVLPGDLEALSEAFVAHDNHPRNHENLANVTPADASFGRAPPIAKQRERIKRQTIEYRPQPHHKRATKQHPLHEALPRHELVQRHRLTEEARLVVDIGWARR